MPVLVVEDDRVNQRVATLQLQKLRLCAPHHCNGSEALEELARMSYPVVLMDCQHDSTKKRNKIKE